LSAIHFSPSFPENTLVRIFNYLLYSAAILANCFCHPRIYSFSALPESAGAGDSVLVVWEVKGQASLLVHDASYPPGEGTALAPITLIVKQGNKLDSFNLTAKDTLLLHLPAAGNLTIRNAYAGEFGERIRSFRLVASKYNKDSVRDRQVVYYPDSASDEIGYRVEVMGDSLVAEGPNNPQRWGDLFEIMTVSSPAGRDLRVSHAGISAVLHPGDVPSAAFAGTPVQGFWSLRSAETEAEKRNPGLIPHGFILHITIKHR
jgi:hypothetical protein